MLGIMTGHPPQPREQEGDHFELANLFAATNGLAMTIWGSRKGGARHDARVKLCMVPGNRMDVSNTAIMPGWPSPALLRGELPPKDRTAVQAGIGLNTRALVDYWNGEIDTLELMQRLRKV